MSNDDFQKLVLEKFDTIENGMKDLKNDMVYVKEKLRVIEDNAKSLTEFKQLVKDNAKSLTEFKQLVKDNAEQLYKKIS
jgi:hypothetical protein